MGSSPPFYLEVQTGEHTSTTATSSYLRFSSQTFFKLGAAASLFCKVDFVSWFSSSSKKKEKEEEAMLP